MSLFSGGRWRRTIAFYLSAFLLLVGFNVALRAESLPGIFFINEDAALIMGAKGMAPFSSPKSFATVFKSYGPRVIRPWQLLGFEVEQNVLGLSAIQSVLVSLVLFSISLLIVSAALRRYIGLLGVAAACVLMSGSSLTAEPLMWLSDRHDVYLILFFSCALATVLAGMEGKLHPGVALPLLGVALVGAFYSNEKAVAVPVILSQLALALFLIKGPTRELFNRAWPIAMVCVVSLSAYFWMRYSLLGTFVGGYDNRVLPDGGLTARQVLKLAVQPFSIPIFSNVNREVFFVWVQVTALVTIVGGLAWLGIKRLTVSTTTRIDRARLVAGVFLLLSAAVVAAIPTLRSFLGTPSGPLGAGLVGVLNTRNFWLPHIVVSLLLGGGYGCLWGWLSDRRLKAILLGLCALHLGISASNGRASARPYALAGQFTRSSVELVMTHCACADLQHGQIAGMPTLYGGVNSFTGPLWVDFSAYHQGLPACTEADKRCLLRYVPESQTLVAEIDTKSGAPADAQH